MHTCCRLMGGEGGRGSAGLLRSFSCDRPLALIPPALKVNSLPSHFTLEGRWKGGRKTRSGGVKKKWSKVTCGQHEGRMGWVKRSHRQINEKSYGEGAPLQPDNEWVLMNAATTNNKITSEQNLASPQILVFADLYWCS